MQILRGAKLSTKFTAFLFLALSTAFSLALIHPQPVNAEGHLFGKVRCVVRTVFNKDCQNKTQQPVAEAPHQGGVTSGGSTNAGQQPGTPPAGSTETAPPVNGAALEPIEIPEELQVSYATLELPEVVPTTSNRPLNESEYAAYFDTFSPYAVAGAKTTAITENAPVQRSAEGWLVLGVAWYWWLIVGLVVGAVVVFRRHIFRPSLRATTVSKT